MTHPQKEPLFYGWAVGAIVALAAYAFRRKNAGAVHGWIFCAHQTNVAAAAWMGSVARDAPGRYGLVFGGGGYCGDGQAALVHHPVRSARASNGIVTRGS